MERTLAILVLCGILFARHGECLSDLAPPEMISVKQSLLVWSQPKNPTDVVYSVECNTTLNEWRNVYRGPQRRFNFSATAEDYYGKAFRVRAERGNQISAWALSKRVQCAHVQTCAPVLELKVQMDKVHVQMNHRDESLKEEEGGHIMFLLQHWKRNLTDKSQEEVTKSTHIVLEHLEPGQEYCFQVKYLNLHQPYGMPSPEICEVIHESSAQRTARIILLGLVMLLLFFFLGSFLYFVYIHHKKIKECLRPPLDIPDHFEEFFFSDFSQLDDLPASPESYEVIIFAEELPVNQDSEQNTDSS